MKVSGLNLPEFPHFEENEKSNFIITFTVISVVILFIFLQMLINTKYQRSKIEISRIEKEINKARYENVTLRSKVENTFLPQAVMGKYNFEGIKRKKLHKIPVIKFHNIIVD